MESTLSLQANLYPCLTPAGAFMPYPAMPPVPVKLCCAACWKRMRTKWSAVRSCSRADTADIDTALNLLYRLQNSNFYGDENGHSDGINLSDEQLPLLMEQLSGSGKALLVDRNGLYLANANFHHESAEELGLLAAEVAQMEKKYRLLIRNNLYINNNAWGVCDPSGQSELTFSHCISVQPNLFWLSPHSRFEQRGICYFGMILYRRYSNRV